MRRLAVSFGVAWLAAACAGPAHAQTPPAPAQPAPAAAAEAPAEPVAPQPIPLAEITSRAEETQAQLRRLAERVRPDPAIAEIEAELPKRRARLDRKEPLLASLAEEAPSLERLADIEREWLLEADAVEHWSDALAGRLGLIEQALAQVEGVRDVWERTRRAAGEAPDSVRQRTSEVLRDVDALRRRLRDRQDALLTLQSQVADERDRVEEVLTAVHTVRDDVRGRLLQPDDPPLWAALSSVGDAAERMGRVREDARRGVAASRAYLTASVGRLSVHLLLFGILIAVALSLRRRAAGGMAADPLLAASAVVFERPYSSAAIVAITLFPWLQPRAPALVGDFFALLVMAPILRLLPRLLEPSLRPAAWGLAVLYGVDLLREWTAGVPLLERMVLSLELAAALAGLLWMLRPARLALVPIGTRVPRVLSALLRGAALLLAAALVANVLGYTTLSKLLGQGVLRSAFVALVFYGAVRVGRAAFRLVLGSGAGSKLRMVRMHGPLILGRAVRAIDALAVAAWGFIVLRLFGVWEGLVEAVGRALGATASFGAIELSLGAVVASVTTIVAAVALSRLLRFVLEEDVFPRMRLGRGVGRAASASVHYALLIGGAVLALAALGVDLNRFTLLAGALGVGVGFGLQNIVNNFLSGLILLYERPIQVGDTVEVGTLMGEVKRIGIRSSTVRTWQGAEVIVPNANLVSDQVVNWTLSDRQRRMEIPVGVAYGTDPERVLAILVDVAVAHSDVLSEPAPMALFMGFGESSLDFELRAWTAHFENYLVTRSQLTVALHAALRDAGITIPFPQRDLHVQSVTPDAGRQLRGRGGEPEPPGDAGASGEEPGRGRVS